MLPTKVKVPSDEPELDRRVCDTLCQADIPTNTAACGESDIGRTISLPNGCEDKDWAVESSTGCTDTGSEAESDSSVLKQPKLRAK